MARVPITLDTRGAAGAAAVDTRVGAAAPARSARRAGGAGAAAGAWSGRRRWMALLALGWLVQAGLRVWFGRQQFMPLANWRQG